MVIDARRQAAEQAAHRVDVRVLEPAPPAESDAPRFAGRWLGAHVGFGAPFFGAGHQRRAERVLLGDLVAANDQRATALTFFATGWDLLR